MKHVINEEFDKREVGHSTFQVQKQVQDMLASFEANVINKLDGLSAEGSNSLTHKNNSSTQTRIPMTMSYERALAAFRNEVNRKNSPQMSSASTTRDRRMIREINADNYKDSS